MVERTYKREQPVIEALKEGNPGRAIKLARENHVSANRFRKLLDFSFAKSQNSLRLITYLYGKPVFSQSISVLERKK